MNGKVVGSGGKGIQGSISEGCKGISSNAECVSAGCQEYYPLSLNKCFRVSRPSHLCKGCFQIEGAEDAVTTNKVCKFSILITLSSL